MTTLIRTVKLSIVVAAVVAAVALSMGASGQTDSGSVSIPLFSRAEMSASDRRLVSESQPAIARSALIYGYALDSSYDYKQIACPLAPSHLLLAYESARPNGAASRFTAVVPRTASPAQPVQVVSISHFGAVPFVPAGSNPHTIEVFNRVVSAAPVGKAVADNPGSNPLLFSSLCYLAMIGESPVALTAPSLAPATLHAPEPTLKFGEKGSVTQVVSVRNNSETYQVWNFAYGRDGRLVSAGQVDYPIDNAPPILNAGAASSLGPPAAPSEVAAAPAVAATTTAPESAAAAPPAASPARATAGYSQHMTLAPGVPVSAKQRAAANVVPRPAERLITDLPQPPSRFIPDASLPYPPQAPVK